MRSICLGMTGSLGWVLSIKYLSRGYAGAIWSMYALSANLLLSHELLRNDLYTPRAVYMATRWVLHFQVCDLQDYFLITSLQSSFFFPPLFVISSRHLQRIVHVLSLPRAFCRQQLLGCADTQHRGAHCFSNTFCKASASFTQHGAQHLWGLWSECRRFFQHFSSRCCLGLTIRNFYQQGFFLWHTAFFLFTPSWIERENNDFTVASPEKQQLWSYTGLLPPAAWLQA